jgi:hypothetical protein
MFTILRAATLCVLLFIMSIMPGKGEICDPQTSSKAKTMLCNGNPITTCANSIPTWQEAKEIYVCIPNIANLTVATTTTGCTTFADTNNMGTVCVGLYVALPNPDPFIVIQTMIPVTTVCYTYQKCTATWDEEYVVPLWYCTAGNAVYSEYTNVTTTVPCNRLQAVGSSN